MPRYKREWFHLDRYTGPNTKYKGRAYTGLEKASKMHDKAYGRYGRYFNPFVYYSTADELHRAQAGRFGWKGRLAKRFWNIKKALAPKAPSKYLGWIYKNPVSFKKKRPRPDDLPSNVVKRSKDNKGKKVPRESKTGSFRKTSNMRNGKFSKRKMPYRKRKRSRVRRKRRTQSKFARKVNRIISRKAKFSRVQDYRKCDNAQWTSTVNTVNVFDYEGISHSSLKLIIDATNPVVDGTTVRWNDFATSLASGRIVLLGNSYMSVTLRNNFNYPVNLDMNWLRASSFTDVGPSTTFSNRLNNYVVNTSQAQVTDAQDSMMYTWSDISTKKWKRLSRKVFRLDPAMQKTVVFKYKRSSMSLSDTIDISDAYGMNFSHVLMVRQYGVPAHGTFADAQSTNNGISDTAVDVIIKNHIKYQLVGGIESRKSEYSETLDALTNPEITVMSIDEKSEFAQ